jgi:hypothetical protein
MSNRFLNLYIVVCKGQMENRKRPSTTGEEGMFIINIPRPPKVVDIPTILPYIIGESLMPIRNQTNLL